VNPPPVATRRSPLEQFLGLFAEVRTGEGIVAILMLLNVFLILSSYYVLKVAREGLILSGGMAGLSGAEVKTYASALMAGLLILIVPAYGFLGSRVRRIRLLNWSYAVILGCLGVFFVLGRSGTPGIGLAFFLWLGIVNMFLVGQFWSYANDVYTEAQGKRLFALIAIGASLGAIAGGPMNRLAKQFTDTFGVMLAAGALLVVCLALFNLVERKMKSADNRAGQAAVTDAALGKDGGFQLILRDRYLLFIALLLLLANMVNSVGEFVLSSAVESHAIARVPDTAHAELLDATARAAAIKSERGDIVDAFFSSFYFWMNLVAFLIQAFLVSRLIKYAGVRVALFVFPVVAFGAYGAIGLIGGLAITRIAKTVDNATDYSVMNTVRHTLWLPTSREAKYKAKNAVDTFFVRTGDAIAALVISIGLHTFALAGRDFAFVNLGLIVVWILVAVGVATRHKKLSPDDKAHA
jgi:AAA family ATP:ADP antiporter